MKSKVEFFTILLLFLLSCRSTDKTFDIVRLNTNYPIILYLNVEHQEVTGIKFPLKLKINNKTWLKQWYSSIEYKYNPYTKGIGESIHIEEDKKLKKIQQNIHKHTYPHQAKEYIMYTRHRIDSNFQQFKPYVHQMLNLSQDTLAIGTVKEFKQKHGALLQQLTAGDSIYLRVLNAERNGYERGVKIPVQF